MCFDTFVGGQGLEDLQNTHPLSLFDRQQQVQRSRNGAASWKTRHTNRSMRSAHGMYVCNLYLPTQMVEYLVSYHRYLLQSTPPPLPHLGNDGETLTSDQALTSNGLVHPNAFSCGIAYITIKFSIAAHIPRATVVTAPKK